MAAKLCWGEAAFPQVPGPHLEQHLHNALLILYSLEISQSSKGFGDVISPGICCQAASKPRSDSIK